MKASTIFNKFLTGGIIGRAMEDAVLQRRAGSSMIPFSPLYAFGGLISTENFIVNLFLLILLEEVAGSLYNKGGELWCYSDQPTRITENVCLTNAILFSLMACGHAKAIKFCEEKYVFFCFVILGFRTFETICETLRKK